MNFKQRMQSHFKFIVLVVALVFIGIGLMREEQFVVLKKAVNICLECIGVG